MLMTVFSSLLRRSAHCLQVIVNGGHRQASGTTNANARRESTCCYFPFQRAATDGKPSSGLVESDEDRF
jgi:hypothetical protein